ncbi:MAG: hypothetical protein H7222_04355 [Methylotenera sp.]|nr:hypothetical protein [Oligoflexia bacterium]
MSDVDDIGFSKASLDQFSETRTRIEASNQDPGSFLLHLISGGLRVTRASFISISLIANSKFRVSFAVAYLVLTLISWLLLSKVIRSSFNREWILKNGIRPEGRSAPHSTLIHLLLDSSVSWELRLVYLYYVFSELGFGAATLIWLWISVTHS